MERFNDTPVYWRNCVRVVTNDDVQEGKRDAELQHHIITAYLRITLLVKLTSAFQDFLSKMDFEEGRAAHFCLCDW